MPVRHVQGARRIYDVVLVDFCGLLERLVVVTFDQALERTGNWLLIQHELVLGKQWDFLEHGANVVHTFKQLNVDLEVEGNLSLLLLSLKLYSLVLLLGNLLSQEFAVFAVLADVGQNLVGFLDLAQAEGAQADLDQGAVVQNLVFHGLRLDQRAQVRLH